MLVSDEIIQASGLSEQELLLEIVMMLFQSLAQEIGFLTVIYRLKQDLLFRNPISL